MSGSMYMIQRDLVQIVCVKYIMLGDVYDATVIPLLFFWGGGFPFRNDGIKF